MNKNDFFFLLFILVLFLPFVFIPELYAGYKHFNADHAYIMAFLKFGLLATAGEMLGLRIKTGNYSVPGFGILPRAVVWGLLGIWIAIAMKVFATGSPLIVQYLGVDGVVEAMKGGFSVQKLLGAFGISLLMNTSFAPVFMTIHKVTDTHIINNGGKLSALITPIPFGKLLASLNWKVQWDFVFKKTIPFFWIPAHTVTFLLPADMQVLFAAVLSIVLGVLLAVAAVLSGNR
ncbi:MAG: hypothetical protein FWF52_05035 [Candidatus Azobacteroides sp.]|nr:hypothetical protein [Candidatus Azobacteroides sp.]